MADPQTRLITSDEGVTTLSIDRPGALNALNRFVLMELRERFQSLNSDPSIKVIILTGEGKKAFVAGADISEMTNMDCDEAIGFSKLGHEVTHLIETSTKPCIAAVNGYALGGGMELALACDIVFASENAVFGLPEVSLGVIPGFGGVVRLPKWIGTSRAKELIFSGRKLNALEAKELGIVSAIYPLDNLLDESLKMARSIAANSQPAIRAAKRMINEFSELGGLDYKLTSEAQEFGRLFAGSDQKEGMKAFTEKRKPKFT